MRVPFEWLKEFVVIEMGPQELARRLTMRGLEVEAVEEQGISFHGVLAGRIDAVEPHPGAENLSLCRVDTGKGILPIVCGAKNISPGQIVPVAVPGATLDNSFTIEKKAIRGVESMGMLCSERELGLSDDHSGIFILPDTLDAGTLLEESPLVRDVVLDVSVPPNRGDCLSIFGIAREVGSILSQKAKIPLFGLDEETGENVSDYVSLTIETFEGCPRYVLRMIKDMAAVPSPFWMRSRLLKCGMRPINSIVDVTNYVMLELGQPLHAFDYGKIRGKRIEVRLAEGDTIFRTLDGTDRKLASGDILICDGKGPVAVAGVMGGENSEIDPGTKIVALESAYFNPLFIRRTARRIGIKSEASLRFEKGIDFDTVDFASQRAIYFMHKISGGTIVKGKVELTEERERKTIFVAFGNVNGVLGTVIEPQDITQALRSIDLHIVKEEESGLVVSVPNFRHDLDEYMDIIEEVARIYGFEHIPATSPASTLQVQRKDRRRVLHNAVKEYLCAAGFFEFISFAFVSPRDMNNFLIPPADERMSFVTIMNPISKEQEVMRTFIAPGVLRGMAYNLNRGARNLRVFETGKVFFSRKEGLPVEDVHICFAITGKERDYFWKDTPQDYDFFDLKGVAEGLLTTFGIDFSVDRNDEPFLNTNQSADILAGGVKIGWIGELKEEVLKAYDIEQKVYCAELLFGRLLEFGTTEHKFSAIPRFPPSTRDFSFFVDEGISAGNLIDRVKKISPLITSVGVFDNFKKEERSIAFRVVFQSFEDTLKDETVNRLQNTIIQELTTVDGVRLRS